MFKKFMMTPFFNVDGQGGGDTGGGAVSTPQSFTQGTPNWGMPNQGAPTQTPTQTQIPTPVVPTPVVPQQQEMLDFGGRKIPVADPSIRDLHKDFNTLQSTYTKTNQELLDLRTQNQMFQQMIQQQMNGQGGAGTIPPQQAEPQLSAEQVREEFMSKFYDDPMTALEELINKKVQPVVEPITKEREWNAEVQRVSGKFTDFQDMVPHMEAILQENPNLAKQGLETVYMYAKGRSAQSQVPAQTPEQMLQDPEFLKQIMGNENITNQIVSQYVNNKQATNQGTPTVLGNQYGGSMPSMPDNKPKTLGDASRAYAKYLGLN